MAVHISVAKRQLVVSVLAGISQDSDDCRS